MFQALPLYHKAIEETQQSRVSTNYIVLKPSGHACRKHSPAARVFYIILLFSNARRVLSQCTFFFVRTLIARARMHVRNSRQRSQAKPIAPRLSSENRSLLNNLRAMKAITATVGDNSVWGSSFSSSAVYKTYWVDMPHCFCV